MVSSSKRNVILLWLFILPYDSSNNNNYNFYNWTIIPRIRFLTSTPNMKGLVSSSIFLKFSSLIYSKSFGEDVCDFPFVEECLKWIVLAFTRYQIRWYFVLVCLVWSWNFGFLANLITKLLPTYRGVEFTCFSYKYSSTFSVHTISFATFATTTYSTFVVEYVGTNYLYESPRDSW